MRIARVFADFGQPPHADWLAHAYTHGLQAVLQVSGGRGKNSTDIRMAIEAMDICHAGHVDTVLLASGDRDFAPLAQRLRAGGLRVMGIGSATADSGFARCCDGYYSLAVPAKASAVVTPARPAIMPAERAAITSLLADMCAASGDGTVSPGVFGAALHAKHKALAIRIGNGKLLKTLREHELAQQRGSGDAIKLTPRKTLVAIRAA